MTIIIFSIFIVLHGLVHMLYFGHIQRYFELQPDMTWPDNSWLLSRFFSQQETRKLAAVLVVLVALIFVGGGFGLMFNQDWWHPMVVEAAALSSLVYLIFWDGTHARLDNQGFVGMLINLALLIALLVFGWPPVTR